MDKNIRKNKLFLVKIMAFKTNSMIDYVQKLFLDKKYKNVIYYGTI